MGSFRLKAKESILPVLIKPEQYFLEKIQYLWAFFGTTDLRLLPLISYKVEIATINIKHKTSESNGQREGNSGSTVLGDCSDRVHQEKEQKQYPHLFPICFVQLRILFNSVSQTQCEKAIFSKLVLKTLL